MVLEQYFTAKWVEKKPRHAFLLGLIYAIVGIISAKFIFGANPGMMTVAFTSILLIPSLNRLLADEENVEIREKKLSLKLLFKDHKDIFEIYIFLFLGIFASYVLFSLVYSVPETLKLFAPQLKVAGITGRAFDPGFFSELLINNLKVMLVCLVLSLVYGAGSILFITWNASVWGVFFGIVAKEAALEASGNPLLFFISTIIPQLPHLVTEAASYFSAAIVGGVMSKAVLREELHSEKFYHIITDALIFLGIGVALVVLAAFIEAR
jgi:uncharacterized membrane protein SpoIIM required for sporulation